MAVMLAAAIMSWILSPQIRWEAWPELLLFMVLISLAAMFPIPDPRGGFMTATGTLFYVLLSVHGPGAGLLVGGSAIAIGYAVSTGWFPWKTVFNGAQMGISVGLAGVVFKIAGGSVAEPGVYSFLIPLILAVFVHHMANNFLVSFYHSRLRGQPLLPTWISDIRDFLWSNILGVPTAALLTILYVTVHPATLLFYLASLPLLRWAGQLYLQRRRIYGQAIDSLVVAIDANLPEGKGHSRRVAATALAIGRNLNLAETTLESIELGALLHDVGMIGLDDVVEESTLADVGHTDRLQKHVQIGAEIAREIPRREIAEIVLYHHENYDGSGYPEGLKGNKIPLGARIVGLAETFESMLAGEGPREQGLSPSEAIKIIQERAGKQYDPRIVEAFVEAFAQQRVTSAATPPDAASLNAFSSTGAMRQ